MIEWVDVFKQIRYLKWKVKIGVYTFESFCNENLKDYQLTNDILCESKVKI